MGTDYLNNRCWHCGHAVPHGTLCCGTVLSQRKEVAQTAATCRRSVVVLKDTRDSDPECWLELVAELYEGSVLTDVVRIPQKRFPDYEQRAAVQVQTWLYQ